MAAISEKLDIFSCSLHGMSLIEASAGTGKTWNICGLYLRLLLEARRTVPEILVVTFTTAATAELKERIRHRIADTLFFLDADDDETRCTLLQTDSFLAMLHAWMSNGRMDRNDMRTRLRAAMASFDEAAIFTIHSFCQKVLASRAFSAGQVFSATVEPDDVEIITDVANDFWRRHIASGKVSRALLMYLTARRVTPDVFRHFLQREFKKPLAKKCWPEGIESDTEQTFDGLVSAFEAMSLCWQNGKETICQLVVKAAQEKHLNGNRYKPRIIADAFMEYELLFHGKDALSAYAKAGSDEEKRLARLTRSHLEEATSNKGITPCHDFFELAQSWMDLRTEALASLDRAYQRLLFLLADEVAEVGRRKQEKRVMSYDDMLFNLHAALTEGSYLALAASVREMYPAALIDEFQDTDPVQFSIFSTIYAGSNLPVFLVGDPKQAIYSFRNADLHTYLRAKKTVSRHYSLTHNQRSTPRLIDACNALFMQNPQAFMLEGLDYQPVSPGERKRDALADDTIAGSERPDGMVLWQLPGKEGDAYLTRSEAAALSANAVADEIARLLKAGETGQIRIGEKKLLASDIAVLVRSHREGSMVQQALANRQIGSVSLSQESIWHSSDARELLVILSAILLPRHTARLKAALATEMLGFDSDAIEHLLENPDLELEWLARFIAYLAAWQNHGIGFVLKQIMSELGVYTRLLVRPDGERRLTNLMHLAELLGQASVTHATPESLIRWFNRQLSDSTADEDTQLRLESDEQLVHILTIHRAKGLEFPFVFCPFLWDAYQRNRTENLPGVSYHDGETLVIDFCQLDENEAARIRQQNRMESAAENLRLLYVAMTRAVFRCYVVTGCYLQITAGTPSARASASGLLNWLAAGGKETPQNWLEKPSKERFSEIEAAWQTLADSCEGMMLKPLSEVKETPGQLSLWHESRENALTLTAAPLPGYIPPGWRIGSYSGLILGAMHELAGSDYDERVQDIPTVEAPEEALKADDILLFPAQRYAGNCLHAVFEEVDFTDEATWDAAIENALLRHPPYGRVNPDEGLGPDALKPMVRKMLADVLNTPLQDGVRLADISLSKRLTELAFFLPSRHLSAGEINTLLSPYYAIPTLAFQRLEGYLKGFIDLVIEHEGRFYILDWKSNFLGNRKEDYDDKAVQAAMAGHSYHLQHLLYTLALDRYLRQRIADYHYETHFGGVFYLFVRGVRPTWTMENGHSCGVFFHRADEGLIALLDGLVDGKDKRKRGKS